MDITAPDYLAPRDCLRQPIAALFEVADLLEQGVDAHMAGDAAKATACFKAADMQEVRDYTESMWGARPKWPEQVHYLRLRPVGQLPPSRPVARGVKISAATKKEVVARDGFHCRYCGIKVAPTSIPKTLRAHYPDVVSWGRTNASQHAGFQAIFFTPDHVLPLALGGANDASNIVVSCVGCNFMKWNYHLSQIGLNDPRDRAPVSSSWDGLTRLLGGPDKCPL